MISIFRRWYLRKQELVDLYEAINYKHHKRLEVELVVVKQLLDKSNITCDVSIGYNCAPDTPKMILIHLSVDRHDDVYDALKDTDIEWSFNPNYG